MSYQGKYTQKKGKKTKKTGLIVLLVVVLLLAAIGIGVFLYMNSLIDIVTTKPTENTHPTLSQAEIDAILNPGGNTTADATETTEAIETTVETSPEDTWPVIESDENLTHIMLVGQAARAGEEYKLADTMILCTINRETKTLTMTSFMRDLFVTIPAYWGHTQGGNRINNVYHLGYYYGGDGMEMLELCIEQNFGIKVDHTIEINFEVFNKVIDIMGGVNVELTKAEYDYMVNDASGNVIYMNRNQTKLVSQYGQEAFDNLLAMYTAFPEGLSVGPCTLNGDQALVYARMRKIDSDFERTRRQRTVITSLINSCRSMGIMDIHAMFNEVLPLIKTNMSNEEIWNYAFEFIPLLKDLQIQTINIPQDVTWWSQNIGTEEVPNYVLKCNMWEANKFLREQLGIIEEETE